MTRGKYAAKSALRREDADVRSELGSYQHHVKRLTAENADLQAKLAASQVSHKNDVKRLTALLNEGLSPEVAALRRELERQRERADHAIRDQQEVRKKWDNAFRRMLDLYRNTEGGTNVDALDALMQFCNPDLQVGTIAGAGTVHEGSREQLGVEAVVRIDRARRFTGGTEQMVMGKESSKPSARRAE